MDDVEVVLTIQKVFQGKGNKIRRSTQIDKPGIFIEFASGEKFHIRVIERPTAALLAREEAAMLANIELYNGIEVHRDDWPIAERLAAARKINLSPARRGPERTFRRATPAA